MDIRAHNRTAWNRKVEQQDRWTVPVSTELVNQARSGNWEVLLTPTKPVPRDWFPNLQHAQVLCLASGGGQQAPIFAAAGADVSSLDNSPSQLEQDRKVADREGLTLKTIEGDMADLSCFQNDSFDLVFHPCSNCYIPDVRPVWQECARVLRSGGTLLSGFANPLRYLFDDERLENGSLAVRHPIPYSDLTHLTGEERQRIIIERGQPFEFGHTLDDQIGGQLDAGFLICGFFEDRLEDTTVDPISRYISTFIATRAIRP